MAAAKKPVKVILPKTIGEAVDALYRLKEELAKANAVAAQIEERDKAMREAILKKFGAQKMGGAKGMIAQCTVTQPIVPVIDDWDAVYDWVLNPLRVPARNRSPKALEIVKERLSIFQRRLGTEMWRQLLDAGTPISGTSSFTLTRLSLTALKGAKGKVNAKTKK